VFGTPYVATARIPIVPYDARPLRASGDEAVQHPEAPRGFIPTRIAILRSRSVVGRAITSLGPDGQQGLKVLPWLWIVERTFAWPGRYRRPSKDHERSEESSESRIYSAMAHLMLRRLEPEQVCPLVHPLNPSIGLVTGFSADTYSSHGSCKPQTHERDFMDTRDVSRSIELRKARLPHLGAAPANPDRPGVGGARSIVHIVARGILRSWWLVLPLWGICSAALAGYVNYKMKPTYQAESLLRVDQLSANPFNHNVPVSLAQNESLETQVQLITSTNVLLAAAADAKIAGLPIVRDSPDPAASLRNALLVKIIPKTSLIQVATESNSSAEAAEVVNTIVATYLKADAEWSDSLSRKHIERLTEFQGTLQTQLEECKKEWLELAAKGNVDPEASTLPVGVEGRSRERSEGGQSAFTHSTVTVQEYGQVRGQLVQCELDLVEAESQVDALGLAAQTAPTFDPSLDPDLKSLAGQMEKVRRNLAAATRAARDPVNEPTSVRYRAHYRELLESYERLHKAKKAQWLRGAPVANTVQSAAQSLRQAITKVSALRSKRAKLQSMIEQLKVDNQQQGTDTVKVALVRSDLDLVQSMLAEVIKRLETLRFESRRHSRILLIDEARPSASAARDKRSRYLTIIPFAVLVGLLGLITALELYAGRVDCPDDLSRLAHVEVFPVPPLPKPDARFRLRGFRRPLDRGKQLEMFANRIDHMRVALCDADDPGRVRCLMITSASVGEGKTTLSIQLAARCADAGLSTLLIDADLRRSSLGRIFDVPDSPGLSEVLRGLIHAEDAIVRLPLPGCQLLTAGSLGANPGRLIQGRQFREVLDRLRGRFDMIIIDTPPLLPVPDALTMGRYTDGAVLATRHDSSRMSPLERAQRLLVTAHIPLLGIAINGSPRSGSRYGNYPY
jgi:succinoglycan biosynthesis transport protein ExoP